MTKFTNIFFFWLFAFALSLGQLTAIKPYSHITIYLHDIIGAIWLLYAIKKTKLKKIQDTKYKILNPKTTAYYLLPTIFTLWSILSLTVAFFNGTNIIIPILYILRLAFYTAIILNSYSVIRKSKKLTIIHHPLSIIISSGIAVMLFGYLQYLLLPDTRFLYIMGWDDHYYRLISTLLDPTFTGIILVLTVINLQPLQSIKENLKLLLSILLTGAITLTYSRSSYLALAVSLVVILVVSFIKKQKKKIQDTRYKIPITLLATSCLLLTLLPKTPGEGTNLNRTSTIEARQTNLLENIPTDPKTLFIGQGLFVNLPHPKDDHPLGEIYQSTNIPNHAKIPDNFFIFILESTGIPGLILMILMLLQLGKVLYQKNQYLFASLIALLIHSQFNASITQPFVFLYFGMIIVMSFPCKRESIY